MSQPVHGIALGASIARTGKDDALAPLLPHHLVDGPVVQERVQVVGAAAVAAVGHDGVGRKTLAVVSLEGGHACPQVGPMLLLPPGDGLRVGKVHRGRLGILQGGSEAAVARARQISPLLPLSVQLGVPPDIGVLPQGEAEAALAQPGHQLLRLPEALSAPAEMAAIPLTALAPLQPQGVQMDHVARDARIPQARDDALHLPSVAVHAARPPYAQGPQGDRGRPPGETGVQAQELARAIGQQQEDVQVGVFH